MMSASGTLFRFGQIPECVAAPREEANAPLADEELFESLK